MKRAAQNLKSADAGLVGLVLILAVIVRFARIGYGLPQVFNADEPHILNIAVSLSGGLNPFSFKYPTLWPTILAFCYGIWFAVWSGFGVLRSTVDFAALFAFRPTGFYLIARVLAALCQIGGLVVLALTERRLGQRRWPWGAAILAVAPILTELAHSAKPDSLLFLLICGAYAAGLKHQAGGGRASLLLCAGFAGAACSAQYTAVPAGLIVPLCWLLHKDGPGPISWLFQAGLVSVLAFLAGTPFAVLDYPRFAANWTDYAEFGRLRSHDALATGRGVLRNIWCFGGDGSPAGLAAAAGALLMFQRVPKRGLLLLLLLAAYAVVLTTSSDGGNARYLIGVYPALAILAGEGLSALVREKFWRRALAAVLVLTPGIIMSAHFDANLFLPDTRDQATRWIADNIPAGDSILLDQPHAGPYAIVTREQAEELAARAQSNGSPRAKLYRAMAARHPGGGWIIFRIKRAASDLLSMPQHVAKSQADGDFLDVRPGLDVVRAARIGWIVTTSYGADPRRSRELATFFSELASQARLVKEFPSEPGQTTGPWLRIYSLSHAGRK